MLSEGVREDVAVADIAFGVFATAPPMPAARPDKIAALDHVESRFLAALQMIAVIAHDEN